MAEGPLHLLLFQIKFQQFRVKCPKTSRCSHQAGKIKAIKAIFQDDAGAPVAPSPKFKSSPPPQKKERKLRLRLFNNSDPVWGVSTGGDHSRCRLGTQNREPEFDTLADGGPGYKTTPDVPDG